MKVWLRLLPSRCWPGLISRPTGVTLKDPPRAPVRPLCRLISLPKGATLKAGPHGKRHAQGPGLISRPTGATLKEVPAQPLRRAVSQLISRLTGATLKNVQDHRPGPGRGRSHLPANGSDIEVFGSHCYQGSRVSTVSMWGSGCGCTDQLGVPLIVMRGQPHSRT